MIIMVSEWIACLDKRPCDRSGEDLDIIYSRLKDIKVFERFHPLLLQQICYYGYYEDLEKGVTLFRQGDIGTNWYTVLSGSLEVRISETGRLSESVTLCTFGPGTSFGESVLTNRPRHCTIITRDCTELIRVEQKDFRILWEGNQCICPCFAGVSFTSTLHSILPKPLAAFLRNHRQIISRKGAGETHAKLSNMVDCIDERNVESEIIQVFFFFQIQSNDRQPLLNFIPNQAQR